MSEPGAAVEMRRAFADELVAMGADEPRLVVLDNDVGLTSLSQGFREAYPERYIDLGIAEKNLFGTAAGLALGGFIAMPTTFAAFATRCALDQVAISIAYPGLEVKIPGHYIGGSRAGSSHIALEDLAVYRALPNMRVADPADNAELRRIMRKAIVTPGPVYYRVSKLAVPDVLPVDAPSSGARGLVLREGRDVSLFATGLMTTMSSEGSRATVQRGCLRGSRSPGLDQADRRGAHRGIGRQDRRCGQRRTGDHQRWLRIGRGGGARRTSSDAAPTGRLPRRLAAWGLHPAAARPLQAAAGRCGRGRA